MLAVALGAIVLGSGLVTSFEALDAALRAIGRPMQDSVSVKNGFSIFNAVVSSLGGALIGAAVSNKASLLHKRQRRRIEMQIASIRNRIEELRNGTQGREKPDASTRLIALLSSDLHELERELETME